MRLMQVFPPSHEAPANISNPRLQQNARQPDTFSPNYISLRPDVYKSMVTALHLPYRSIESNSCVGPFFWSAWDQDEETPHLRIYTHIPPSQITHTNTP